MNYEKELKQELHILLLIVQGQSPLSIRGWYPHSGIGCRWKSEIRFS